MQHRGDPVPRRGVLREAVQQHHGCAGGGPVVADEELQPGAGVTVHPRSVCRGILLAVPATPGLVQTTGLYRPLLGTDVEIRVAATDAAVAATAERAAVEQLLRAQRLFSVFDPDSALCRWRAGAGPAPELADLLAVAAGWWARVDGAFHPVTAGLHRRWRQAEVDGRVPSRGELAQLAAGIAELPYAVDRCRARALVRRLGDCADVDLNALAKGYAVDLAVAAALAVPGVAAVGVNAGGDIRHAGCGSVRVGVEDPARTAANAPRLAVVELVQAAVATSGSAHRGFQVAGRWLGHVIDPRSGWPVTHTLAATVIADDATTADALATALLVLDPSEAVELADDLGIAALLVTAEPAPTRVRLSRAWPADDVRAPGSAGQRGPARRPAGPASQPGAPE